MPERLTGLRRADKTTGSLMCRNLTFSAIKNAEKSSFGTFSCAAASNISSEYEKKLRERRDLFRVKTKTRKAVVYTFVTTYGVGQGKHSGIVHSEVTMDDLFRSS